MKRKKRNYRAVTFLDREELDFLDGIGKDIYFSKGINIPRQEIIKAIIDAFKDERAKNKKELEDAIADDAPEEKDGARDASEEKE